MGDHRGGQPGVVDVEVGGGQVGAAGVFQVADQFLGASATALECFEVADVGVGLIGDERLEPAPADIGERQLCARMGDLATHDHPGAGRPPLDVDHRGDLGDLGVVAVVAAVIGDRWPPRLFRNAQTRFAYGFGQIVTDTEPDVRVDASVDEPVRQPGRVGTGDHLDHGRVDRDLANAIVSTVT